MEPNLHTWYISISRQLNDEWNPSFLLPQFVDVFVSIFFDMFSRKKMVSILNSRRKLFPTISSVKSVADQIKSKVISSLSHTHHHKSSSHHHLTKSDNDNNDSGGNIYAYGDVLFCDVINRRMRNYNDVQDNDE